VAGEIAEIGPGVTGLEVGDRVAVEAVSQGKACGKCRFCLAGQFRRCTELGSPEEWIKEGWGGGFAEYIQRKAMACYKLPDHVSWEEGALVEPLAVGVHGVRRARMLGGETVVVLGAGTIGLTAVAAARSLGAGKVFATARYGHQAEMAMKLGADSVLPTDTSDLQEAVTDLADDHGADITIVTVSGADFATMEQAYAVTRGMGRIIVLAIFHHPASMDFMEPFRKEQSIIFSQCYSYCDEIHDFAIARDIMGGGRLPFKEMVTHTFPFEKAKEALDTAYDKTTGCIKVQFTT
jgi:threonine dehydrogenase-like Zn-dependent dehydrogenase